MNELIVQHLRANFRKVYSLSAFAGVVGAWTLFTSVRSGHPHQLFEQIALLTLCTADVMVTLLTARRIMSQMAWGVLFLVLGLQSAWDALHVSGMEQFVGMLFTAVILAGGVLWVVATRRGVEI